MLLLSSEPAKNSAYMQSVSEDLRVFVEVLQSFCDDPRDLAEVRTSESKLKTQLSAVQKQLKSHELQVRPPPPKPSSPRLQNASGMPSSQPCRNTQLP